MKTVILCGGLGTRMKEITEHLPKPLVRIGEMPILWHIMKYYSHFGFNEFVLCLGYKGEKIKEFFEKNNSENWSIEFADTGLNTNTGGRIKKIKKFVEEEKEFFCTYGDGLADINLKKLLESHKKHKKTATITVVHPSTHFGLLKINKQNAITEFREKPKLEQWVNGGFFVFDKKIFDFLGEEDVLEKETFGKLVKNSQISAFRHSGFWECMDTFKDNTELNSLWKEGKAKWKAWK